MAQQNIPAGNESNVLTNAKQSFRKLFPETDLCGYQTPMNYGETASQDILDICVRELVNLAFTSNWPLIFAHRSTPLPQWMSWP